MPTYHFTYNVGSAREWKSRHEWLKDDEAIRSAELRTGAIDGSVKVEREEPSALKTPLGRWAMVDGKREWTKA